jgi:hypothetical protein
MARYALIIGISQYRDPSFRILKKPPASATKIAQLLKKYGEFEVEYFPRDWEYPEKVAADLEVSANDLWKRITLFLKKAQGNAALFYFCGHGFLKHHRSGGEEVFLATSDTQIRFDQENEEVTWDNGESISLEDLKKAFLLVD